MSEVNEMAAKRSKRSDAKQDLLLSDTRQDLLQHTASLSALGYEHNLTEPAIRLWNEILP